VNIAAAVNEIAAEYGLNADETPVTTEHGSNIVAVTYDWIVYATASTPCWSVHGKRPRMPIQRPLNTRRLSAICVVTLSRLYGSARAATGGTEA